MGRNRWRPWWACLAVGWASAAAAWGQVGGDDVRRAIERGVAYLRREQVAHGGWLEQHYPGGETALATFALLTAGEPPGAPHMRRALERVRDTPNEHVYVVSLKILALTAADAEGYRDEILAAARFLVLAQTEGGLWGYTRGGPRWDHSNSQYALLGLHAAAEAGVPIPGGVWAQARARVIASQNDDGGWAYRTVGHSYGSMTAANVCNLVILGGTIALPMETRFENGMAPRCGKYAGNGPLLGGLRWLANNFRVDQNPQRGGSFQHYWLYAAERAGMLTGRQYFGAHDWYRAGAEELVRTQNADGSWGRRAGRAPLVETSFGLLFLAKGHKPLLIQKLEWSRGDEWNLDRHDVQHLVEFIGDKLGEPTAWQVVAFDQPLEDWLAAPLLYVQGHEFPRWNEAQRAKVREYVEKGGTVLFEACCGREAFATGMEAFAAQTFPDAPLRELDAGHPIFRSYYELPRRRLHGIDVGCRTSVIFSPNDLSCLWEQQHVPLQSEEAFKLGTNIAAFATGRQALRDRLDVVTVPENAGEDQVAAKVPPGLALRLAQVVYDGDWRPDAGALVGLAEFLRDEGGLDVVTQYATVRLEGERLGRHPILYLTGHFGFELTSQERAALAEHLRRGGFLLADACCGREAFDASLRRLVRQMFPDQALEQLAPDHPVLRGQPGFRIDAVTYKDEEARRSPVASRGASGPAAPRDPDRADTPELWGLAIEGRLAVVYSPYALGCGLDGHRCYNCRGLSDDDARRLAANAVLHALTH